MPKISFHWQTLFAVALGVVLGLALGPAAAPLGKLGSALIQIIKALATPLLFFVLLDSFLRSAIRGRSLGILLGVCAINAGLATLIGMGLSNWFRPGDILRARWPQPLSEKLESSAGLLQVVLDYIPKNLFEPFLTHSIPGAILLALLFGLALQRLKKEGKDIALAERCLDLATQIIQKMIALVVRISPLAILAVTAQSVGVNGFGPFTALLAYVGCALLGMSAQIVLVYQAWVRFFCGVSLKRFWKAAKDPVVYSFGVNSSLATLPLTLQALDDLKVSSTASRMGAGLGTNFNNDGILLYEAMAVLMVAQAYGIQLSFTGQLGLALSCVVTSFGVAGVPEAGIVALSLVLTSAGLPTEVLPLLLTVDWVVARCRSATNVLGDMTVSLVLNKAAVPAEAVEALEPPRRREVG